MAAPGGGTLAELVRARRRALGLTPAALAERAGVGRYTLRSIEAGRTVCPQPATLAALAGALDLPRAALAAALPPDPAAARAARAPGGPPRRGGLGGGRARGEARPALTARLGAHGSLWLCHDCAANEPSVAELLAAYRRARAGGG